MYINIVPSVIIFSVVVLGTIVGFLPEKITIIGIQIMLEITKTQTHANIIMTFPEGSLPERAPMVTDM